MPREMRAPYTTELRHIYAGGASDATAARLSQLVDRYRNRIPAPGDGGLSERDSILIVYPNQLTEEGRPPLQVLAGFCSTRLHGLISSLHLLPFFPWSSDDGFAVKDYRQVDPGFGSWDDIQRLSRTFRLMVDGVINHTSARGPWFAAYLRDEAPYRGYFLSVEDGTDLSRVVRPRSAPLLTDFQTAAGLRHVWTTFGPDQVDLDYHDPDVLLDMFDVLLGYAQRGAQFIRLDAVAYLWKESGTSCIHLPQTHAIIRLLRAVLDEVAPHVRLVSETNVAHVDNVSYFGDGSNEAQLVYNFALPPLVLHTFHTGDSGVLSGWASKLEFPSGQCSFINFLASHDGIGLNPARGLLSESEIDNLVKRCLQHGGQVSYANVPGGSQRAYELNVNYFDALSDPRGAEPIELQVRRFMAAQAIMLCLRGIPGIYFHSLFGSRNWAEGPALLGHKRAINRQKLEVGEIETELDQQGSLRSMVFERFKELLKARAASPAFDPNAPQQVLDAGNSVFAVRRISPDGRHRVLCLANVTSRSQALRLDGFEGSLEPYEARWITPGSLAER